MERLLQKHQGYVDPEHPQEGYLLSAVFKCFSLDQRFSGIKNANCRKLLLLYFYAASQYDLVMHQSL